MADEWFNDFPAFLAHIGIRPSDAHSIERKDVNAGYEPGNVCWATKAEQALNKRNTLRLTVNGVVTTLIEACRNANVSYSRAHYWMHHRGYSFDEAVDRIRSAPL